jgi:MerR family transcriptional regulator, light-induced transcriptional regulator
MSESREITGWPGQTQGRIPMGAPRDTASLVDSYPDGRSGLEQGAVLGDAIEKAIIPRLILYGTDGSRLTERPTTPRLRITPEVAGLTTEVLRGDMAAALRRLEALQDNGWSFAQLCLDALGQSSRLLGRMWEEDRCDFLAVTEGVICLQRLMRAVTPSGEAGRPSRDARHRILLASLPGETHCFGLEVVAEFFRQDGWVVRLEREVTNESLAELTASHWFATVGFSATCDDMVPSLATTILVTRRASRNSGLAIMVGGPLLTRRPDFATLIGADVTAADGPQALAKANHLVSLMQFPD